MPKRKIGNENRQFHKIWETDYFFMVWNGQLQCLLCNTKLASMKKTNISRHYNRYHAEKYASYSAQCRQELVNTLKMYHQNKPQSTDTHTVQQQSLMASYSVTLKIARANKCFSDGKFVKECAMEMAKAFGYENVVKSFETVSLSRPTINTHVKEISAYIEDKLKCLLENCQYFSLYLDESTDISDISQLSIFIRLIDSSFTVHEELLALVPLCSTTKEIDIFNATREQVEKYGDFNKCTAIVTDGIKAMIGQQNGFRGHLSKNDINCLMFHCSIHQEALFGKNLMLTSTMQIVTKVINLIRNRALPHKKFKNLLKDLDAAHGDLLLCNNIRWLSAGKSLDRVFNLRNEIAAFLENEAKAKAENIQEKFKDATFLSELAFLTDITQHLNCLNLDLQKQHQTISDLIGHIKVFQNQLHLFISELQINELYLFPCCKQIADQYLDATFLPFVTPLVEIQKQFEDRFKDFDILEKDLIIFNNAKGCKIEEQELPYRLELCEIQADSFLLSRNEHGLEFFKLLSHEKYPKLVDLALKIGSMFGSSYKCESSFSLMKNIKCKYRSTLTNDNLSSLLRIACSNITVDLQSLVDQMMRPQCSH